MVNISMPIISWHYSGAHLIACNDGHHMLQNRCHQLFICCRACYPNIVQLGWLHVHVGCAGPHGEAVKLPRKCPMGLGYGLLPL